MAQNEASEMEFMRSDEWNLELNSIQMSLHFHPRESFQSERILHRERERERERESALGRGSARTSTTTNGRESRC